MKRRAIACVAAFAAAVSIGALGYAVLWGFDLAEPGPPAAQPPRETKRVPPRRKAPMVVAPRPPGEDAQPVRSAGEARPIPFGDTPLVASGPRSDETSSLVAVAPPPTPPTPGEDAQRVRSAVEARSMTPSGDAPEAASLPGPDETSSLVAVALPPTPAAPGEDGRPIAAWERASAVAAIADRPMGDDAQARSDLTPQHEAAITPAPEVLPDPEPTASIPPAIALPPTVLMPRPPRRVMARERPPPPPPGAVIVRGVPPVPGDSPGIVRPGPLIIHLPAPVRR